MRLPPAALLLVALAGCGGFGTVTNGSPCSVTITGTPHAGTFTTCIAGNPQSNGQVQLQLSGPANCTSCTLLAEVPQSGSLACAYGSSQIATMQISDIWPGVTGGVAETFNPPGSPASSAPATPCTIMTASYSAVGASAGDSGHWSGTIDGTVYVKDGSGNAIDVTTVQVAGSF